MILCSCRSSESNVRPNTYYSIGQSQSSTQPPSRMMGPGPAAETARAAAAPSTPGPTTPASAPSGRAIQASFVDFGQCIEDCQSDGCPSGTCQSGDCVCDQCPIRGPNDEYLCDGGDYGVPAGVRTDREVQGLEQEDTIAHYDTVDGRTIVTPSNKVCIYAPRFGAIRRVIDAQGYTQSTATGGMLQEAAPVKAEDLGVAVVSLADLGPQLNRKDQPASLLLDRLMPGELDRDRIAREDVGTVAPSEDLQMIAAHEVIGEEGAEIARKALGALAWSGVQAPQIILENVQAKAEVSVLSPGTVYALEEPNSPRLRLIKLASTGSALPGEEIEFTLRYDNIGDREIENVTIVDNLTTRLRYVADSQESSREATFVSDPNDGGSLVLKWSLSEPLPPGEGGVITFRCQVR